MENVDEFFFRLDALNPSFYCIIIAISYSRVNYFSMNLHSVLFLFRSL